MFSSAVNNENQRVVSLATITDLGTLITSCICRKARGSIDLNARNEIAYAPLMSLKPSEAFVGDPRVSVEMSEFD